MENNNTPIVMHDDHMSCEDVSIAFSYKSLNLVSFLYPMICPDKSNRVYEAVRLPIVTGTGMDESWFTRLNYIAIDRKNTRSIQKSGWKFHISLADVDDNIANGWDIAKRYLIMYHTFVFKIIRDEFRSRYSSNKQQAGKIITIYAYYENREPNEWEIIFNQITAEFIKNNIQPGKLPVENYVVKQSSYFSYRNDKHGFIYDTNNDPYKKITINIPDQPRIENEA